MTVWAIPCKWLEQPPGGPWIMNKPRAIRLEMTGGFPGDLFDLGFMTWTVIAWRD